MASNLITINNAQASNILAQLRDGSLKPAAVRALVSEWTSALAKQVLKPVAKGEKVAVIVILRSGLAMSDSFLSAFPEDADVAVYHLGLFRDKQSFRPVEYYNKLPPKSPDIKRAYILDPLVATGGTAKAAVQIVKEWGVEHVTLFSLLGSAKGVENVANYWSEGCSVYIGAIDQELDERGYVKPGVGDIGDRLFGTALE